MVFMVVFLVWVWWFLVFDGVVVGPLLFFELGLLVVLLFEPFAVFGWVGWWPVVGVGCGGF